MNLLILRFQNVLNLFAAADEHAGLVEVIRERLDELDHLLDHLDGGRVFVGVAKVELLRQDFRAGLGDGTQLEEVDEVDVAEPVRALVFGQVRVEPGTGEKGARVHER